MKIAIDEYYSIEPDSCSWNLLYEKEGGINAKTGKRIVSSDISYHATLSQALSFYLNEVPKDSATLTRILGRIREAEENIKRLCEGIKKDYFPKTPRKRGKNETTTKQASSNRKNS